MKKILQILLILQILAQTMACTEKQPASSIWNGTADTSWYNDSQTEFTITTPEQLAGLAKLVNGGNNFEGKMVRLGADIMLNDTADWQNWASKPPKNKWKPIGIYIAGKNWPLLLYSHTGYGLLDVFPEFILRALRLKPTDFPFSGTFDGGGFSVSGVYINILESLQGLFGIVSNRGKTELINLNVRASYIKGMGAVGGLVGISDGTVSGCYSSVWVVGTNTLGGLVGNLSGNATIINSYSVSTVSGDRNVGGLVGESTGTIVNSYSASNVSGKNVVGGLAGLNDNIIANSYSTGNVTGGSEIGGLAGMNIGEIINSYSIGTVAGNRKKSSEAGGLVGRNLVSWKAGIVKSSYYNMETSGQSKGIGTDPNKTKSDVYGKTDAEMKERETFKGWDFGTVWGISGKVNGGYPYLLGFE